MRTVLKAIKSLRFIIAPLVVPVLQLLSVAAIAISVLVIYVGFFAEPFKDRNRIRYLLTTMQVEQIAKAVERYRVDCGEYPSAEAGFNALLVQDGVNNCRGPYLKELSLDPWRQPYIYSRLNDSAPPKILSYDADRKPSGEFFDADISSRHLVRLIPESPSEVRANRLLLGSWIGAWVCLVGSIVLLTRISRSAWSLKQRVLFGSLSDR